MQRSMYAPNTGYGLPSNTCADTLGTWVMNVLTMPPHLGHSDLCQLITYLHVGFVITLTHLPVVVIATALETSWKNCVTLELKQLRYLMTGASALFHIGFSMTFTHALHHMLFALSPFSAALGSLGLISSHNIATRWVRHNFDTSACCGDCNSISEVLE